MYHALYIDLIATLYTQAIETEQAPSAPVYPSLNISALKNFYQRSPTQCNLPIESSSSVHPLESASFFQDVSARVYVGKI